jgi:hypothetical protein
MTTLKESQRTISADTMTDVLKYTPKDGFKLTDDILNKEYTVIDIDEFEINDTKTFSVTLESKDGEVITLSAGALKRSRVLSTDKVDVDKFYDDTDNVMMRSEADSVWNGSNYFHKAFSMNKDEDFILPEKVKLRYAILAEDQDSGEPLINPYLYKDFRKVVREYSKRNEYPTMDDFREELAKSEKEGRLAFLAKNMLKPEPYSWVKMEVSDFRHTLVFEKV